MTVISRLLGSGAGWRVDDVVCGCGPHDRPFEERHEEICIAAVTEGIFRYRTPQGSALLAPGSLLLGNHRQCFECGHEHGVGDRCLSFHFTPEFMEAVIRATAGARRIEFVVPRLPPTSSLTAITAAAEAAREQADCLEFEGLALLLAGAVSAILADGEPRTPAPNARDERRVAAALRRIRADAEDPPSLSGLAGAAGMSPFHFLRTFRAVVGVTPHQFILHERLRRAAVRLRQTDDSISSIAFDAGFNDLSTFNRRFRRLIGRTPSAYRAQR
jgi:AraC-like DNA-binding protein